MDLLKRTDCLGASVLYLSHDEIGRIAGWDVGPDLNGAVEAVRRLRALAPQACIYLTRGADGVIVAPPGDAKPVCVRLVMGAVIGKALNEKKIENETLHSSLLKQGSEKVSTEADAGLGIKKAGLTIGATTKATVSGDLKAYADQQLKDLAQTDGFTKQLDSQLTSGKAQSGGAETALIGMTATIGAALLLVVGATDLRRLCRRGVLRIGVWRLSRHEYRLAEEHSSAASVLAARQAGWEQASVDGRHAAELVRAGHLFRLEQALLPKARPKPSALESIDDIFRRRASDSGVNHAMQRGQ